MLRVEGNTRTVKPEFVGYRLGEQVPIQYRLPLPGSDQTISVEELPEVTFDEKGTPGLVRRYRTQDVPKTADVPLRISLRSIPPLQHIQTTGAFVHSDTSQVSRQPSSSYRITGPFRFQGNAVTHLTTFFNRRGQSSAAERQPGVSTSEAVSSSDDGEALYQARCACCNQQDGGGLSGVYPPLASSKWVMGDKGHLGLILLNGMTGTVEVDGAISSGVMPSWASSKNDEELAGVAVRRRGGLGGNWVQPGKRRSGLQRLTYSCTSTFEMLSVQARPTGLAVNFTEPLAATEGAEPEDYHVQQWHYKPTENYGGPKLGQETLRVESVQVKDNRRHVRLEIPRVDDEHVVYLRLQKDAFRSDAGRELWSTEAWYTMNERPRAPSAAE